MIKSLYGGYATLLTAFVLAILVVVNLVVGQIPYKLDLTQNQMFSLSDQTKRCWKTWIKRFESLAYETGQESAVFDEILQRYRRLIKIFL